MGLEAVLMSIVALLITHAPEVLEAVQGTRTTEEALAAAREGVKRAVARKTLADRTGEAVAKRRAEIDAARDVVERRRDDRGDEITQEIALPGSSK